MGSPEVHSRWRRQVALLFSAAAIVSLQLLSLELPSFSKLMDREMSTEVKARVVYEAQAENKGNESMLVVSTSDCLIRRENFAPDSDAAMPSAITENAPNSSKPVLLLHVGPPKSGTTTLEHGFGKFREELKQDGLFYCDIRGVSSCMALSNAIKTCGAKNPEKSALCWSQLKKDLWQLHVNNSNANLFLSPVSTLRYYQRGLKGRQSPVDWVSLKEHLGDTFDIKILFGYRRYVDWLPSAIQQLERSWSRGNWPGDEQGSGRKHEGLFPTRWKEVRIQGAIKYMHTEELVRTVDGTLPYVLFNIHEQYEIGVSENTNSASLTENNVQPSLLSRFACATLPSAGLPAPTMCQNSLFQDMMTTEELVRNPSRTLYYDALAVAALEKGFIINSTATLRKDAGLKAQHFHTKALNQSLSDFPLICMTEDQNQEYLDYSLAIEERLVPDFYSTSQGKATHVEEFWTNVEKNKYCWIDTDKVLEDERWQDFFSGLPMMPQ